MLWRLNPYSNGLLSEGFGRNPLVQRKRLNPYSNGLLSEKALQAKELTIVNRLNPYSNGLLSESINFGGSRFVVVVLILILMDYSLRV